ncbi:MAG: hypothetical protein DMF06_03320 [Verrucomicrobia bacterium]|nr:MAG: hypothetical protein DMF06_03320 [Verrucomicrobiota bacterium]
MREYAIAASIYVELIAGASGRISNLLRRAASMAVGIVTIDESISVFGDKKVEDFWTGIAKDDGLHLVDPRKVAHTHLIETSMRGGKGKNASPYYSARYIANCFNAWVEGREIKFTRVNDAKAPILIAGTSFKG